VNYEKASQYTKKFEGLNLLPYTCPTGHLTIGYGHNLEEGITLEMAETLLQADLRLAEMEVSSKVAYFNKLDEARQFVLVDMCFNMGLKKLFTFKKFFAALLKRDYPVAAREMLNSKWAVQVGNRAKKLAEIMRTGEY
jgi:lysozyme